jgi:hypothetical protein
MLFEKTGEAGTGKLGTLIGVEEINVVVHQ